MNEKNKVALLVVFGDLDMGGPLIRGEKILEMLTSKHVWFGGKAPRNLRPGTPVVFYQSAVGFRGTATLERATTTETEDKRTFSNLPMEMYPFKFVIRDFRMFEQPVHARNLVPRLDFITSKKYWGHAFRSTPRLIPISDLRVIEKAAARLA